MCPIHSAHEKKPENTGSWDEARSAESKTPMRIQTKPVLQMSCRNSIQNCEWEGHGDSQGHSAMRAKLRSEERCRPRELDCLHHWAASNRIPHLCTLSYLGTYKPLNPLSPTPGEAMFCFAPINVSFPGGCFFRMVR